MKQKIDPVFYYLYFNDKHISAGNLFSCIYVELAKQGLRRLLIEEILSNILHTYDPFVTKHVLNNAMRRAGSDE